MIVAILSPQGGTGLQVSHITINKMEYKMIDKSRKTRRVSMRLRNGDPSKRAGSNSLTLTVRSEDWRLKDQCVCMTVRDAQTLQRFLNDSLDSD